jgi:hypothetical protein
MGKWAHCRGKTFAVKRATRINGIRRVNSRESVEGLFSGPAKAKGLGHAAERGKSLPEEMEARQRFLSGICILTYPFAAVGFQVDKRSSQLRRGTKGTKT